MECSEIYGLLFTCPFEQKVENCPSKEIRKINDIQKRIEFVNNLSFEEKKNFISQHKIYLYEREKLLRKLKLSHIKKKIKFAKKMRHV